MQKAKRHQGDLCRRIGSLCLAMAGGSLVCWGQAPGQSEAGSNAGNVIGLVDSLYPVTPPPGSEPVGQPISFSVMPILGTFSTAFDIAPDAKPFSVVASAEGGSTVINLDPGRRTWTAKVSVPTVAVRAGQFARSELSPILDFEGCGRSSLTRFRNFGTLNGAQGGLTLGVAECVQPQKKLSFCSEFKE